MEQTGDCTAQPSIHTGKCWKQQLPKDVPSRCVPAWSNSLLTTHFLTKESWNKGAESLQTPKITVKMQHHYSLECGKANGELFPRKTSPPVWAVGCRMSKVPRHVLTPEKSIITSQLSLWSILNSGSAQPYLCLCQILLNEVYPAFPAWLNIVHPGWPETILYFANIINSNKLSMVCSDNGTDAVMPHRQSLGFRRSFILCAALAISPAPFLSTFHFTSYAGIMPPAVYIKNALYMCWKRWVLCCWQGWKLSCLRSSFLYYYHFCLI